MLKGRGAHLPFEVNGLDCTVLFVEGGSPHLLNESVTFPALNNAKSI